MTRRLRHVVDKFQDVVLEKVTKSDYEFLYELLKMRDPRTNISHKKLPTYDEHVRFVMKKPYKKLYIIKSNDQKVGSIYLSLEDEIGISIKKEFQRKGIGRKAVKLLMEKNPITRYLANVAPNNIKHQEFFKKLGFTGLQYTYEIINPDI
jgi:RimJ/RimL family protein N-acetyltransferase